MSNNIVENPILNSAYIEPARYYVFGGEKPEIVAGRREAEYLISKKSRGHKSIIEDEHVPLELVNKIRERVKNWRDNGYSGTTPTTFELLDYWNREDRERRLFFCQLEAVETIIWLLECNGNKGFDIPSDCSFQRYCCKMATGSGKSTVMAMLIAWSVLNKLANKKSKIYSDSVLIVAPNLTVKDRLKIILPYNEDNYYSKFDLVPPHKRSLLSKGKYLITNWHLFLPQDDSKKRSVVQRGKESDQAFCKRRLDKLKNRKNILVFNDEAHHAYKNPRDHGIEISNEEAEEATVWVEGLERVDKINGINICIDLSATPLYISTAKNKVGEAFPWIVSDFGLVEAIESGIVKVPRIPVKDDSEFKEPKYLNLWDGIKDEMPKKKDIESGNIPLIQILCQTDGALTHVVSQWRDQFKKWDDIGRRIPPVMIIICNNTITAEALAKHIGEFGNLGDELKNSNKNELTIRIDSEELDNPIKIEKLNKSKQEWASEQREKVYSTGKEGKPGEQIRCIVSVSMLSEGWDAQNVTQILGIRAFSSQLLCEQVVGRGLRRFNYDDLTQPEFVDVYGIPFQAIPVVGGSSPKIGPDKTTVRPDKNKIEFRIEFPIIEGFQFDAEYGIDVNFDNAQIIEISPEEEPSKVIVKNSIGDKPGRPSESSPGEAVLQTRESLHSTIMTRQRAEYDIAAKITETFGEKNRLLFPKILKIVKNFINRKVVFKGVKENEIYIFKHKSHIEEQILKCIRPAKESDNIKMLPIINYLKPKGSTDEVLFETIKSTYEAKKCHLNKIAIDTKWEENAAIALDAHKKVKAFVKNDRLGFYISYIHQGKRRQYIPDFIVKLETSDKTEKMLIVEIKGRERKKDQAKFSEAKKWVDAVNNWGKFGKWDYVYCTDPYELESMLNAY